MNKETDKSRRDKATKRVIVAVAAALALTAAAVAVWLGVTAFRSYQAEGSTTVTIPRGSTSEAVEDSLTARLGDYGAAVYRLWSLRGGEPEKAAGIYRVDNGDRAWSVAGRILGGRSSSVRVTFNNVRLMDELAEKVSRSFLWTADEFLAACDSVLAAKGYAPEAYISAFLPDTYEFYASASAPEVVEGLVGHHDGFWNGERLDKAEKLGLTPLQVSVIASIVEEESNNTDERPVIARLYLNRFRTGMKLQADPTVKFALGDFSLRRLSGEHLKVQSPYNTYYVKGLPPGPIRMPAAATLDAVLDAPENDYLYMCAKPRGAGTHNFSHDYEQHKANARIYRAWLDSLNIKY